MSIQHALLALLSAGPATTYQLRQAFDDATGHVRPLNIGQASSTLSRLERDGCVVRSPEDDDGQSAGRWSLTDEGRAAVALWWSSAVERGQPDRQELVVKLALAVTVPGVDVAALVQTQRDATLSALHEVTRVRRSVEDHDLAAALVIEHHLVSLEAELRWLDDIEGTVEKAAARAAAARPSATGHTSDVPSQDSLPQDAASRRSGARR